MKPSRAGRTGLVVPWVFAVALLLGGCVPATGRDSAREDGQPLPSTEPSIRGFITAVEGVRVRIEEDPTQPSGSPKASVRVEAETAILHRDGRRARFEDLEVGRRASAWFEGPVMESHPVQALAGIIVVEPDSL